MKKITLSLIGTIVLFSCGNNGLGSDEIILENNIDSVSYAGGVNLANQISQGFSEGNMEAYIRGFKDVIDSNDLMIATEETQSILQMYSQKRQMEEMAKQQKEQESMYGNVKEEGIKFLAENKTKEGVQVTPSGLQYIVLKEGSGGQPTAESNVEVHYHGTTPDGTVFDSSVDRGETISFGLNQVIPGWTEGVQLMKVGAKYRFFIPQELAYGSQPQRDPNSPIKPYMPLVFEVELFKIN